MTEKHEVRRNEAYAGLCSERAMKLCSYMHFRNVQTEEKKADLDKSNTPFVKNFLEEIVEDEPKGCWVMQK